MDLLNGEPFTATAGVTVTRVLPIVVPPGKHVRVDFVVVDLTGFQEGSVRSIGLFLGNNAQATGQSGSITELIHDEDRGSGVDAFIYDREFIVDRNVWVVLSITNMGASDVTTGWTVAGVVD